MFWTVFGLPAPDLKTTNEETTTTMKTKAGPKSKRLQVKVRDLPPKKQAKGGELKQDPQFKEAIPLGLRR